MKEDASRQTVDEDARRLARRLVRSSAHAALAVIEPGTGAPLASRVLVASDFAGDPVILVSGLSAHTPALRADPRASLLFGEPGRGDPLAHPRITTVATASELAPGSGDHARMRDRFLARHPSCRVYIDFPDFRLIRLRLQRASLVGGFARAYDLERDDLVDAADATTEAAALRALAHMNGDHADAVEAIAVRSGLAAASSRRIATGDARGFELVGAGGIERVEFDHPVDAPDGFRKAYVSLLSPRHEPPG